MRSLLLSTLLIASSLGASAQQPAIVHGQLLTDSSQPLAAELATLEASSIQPVWLGYTFQTANDLHLGDSSRTLFLEGDHPWQSGDSYRASAPQDHATLLIRIADHTISRLRLAPPQQTLDLGNRQLVWLSNVPAADSIATLKDLALHTGRAPRDTAVLALSLHQSPASVPALVDLAQPGNAGDLREKAVFWLSSQHGADALPVLHRLATQDPDPAFREKLTFDLTLIKLPAAVDELSRIAHTDTSPQVRKQAQFWMANLGGQRVSADLEDQAANDPDREVRKSAVFALSRLPAGEATPQLIHVAQTGRDPEVRKQAVFWLGQSDDPHALEYLTTLLKQ